MFSEKTIASFKTRGEAGRLITVESARAELGLSPQRFRRLFRPTNPLKPKRYKVSRVLCVNGTELAACLEYMNALEGAMGLAELARYLRVTYYTALQMYEDGELPDPFGKLRDRPRWRKCDIDTWRNDQLGGQKPPQGYEPPPTRGGNGGKQARPHA